MQTQTESSETSTLSLVGRLFSGGPRMRVLRPHAEMTDEWWCENVDYECGLWLYSTQYIQKNLLPIP